jgi:formylmethanofuran dehydrogenase subunit A
VFRRPDYVFKDGRLVARDGDLVDMAWGATHVARPAFDRGIERSLRDHFERYYTVRLDNFAVADGEIEDVGQGRLVKHAAAGRAV